MTLRLTHLGLVTFAAVLLSSAAILLSPAADAFTFEGGDGKGGTEIPKFDIEEQSRQFKTRDLDNAWGKREVQTPFGKGSLQFGVQQPGANPFGSGFNSKFSPHDMDRLLAPPGLQHRFDGR